MPPPSSCRQATSAAQHMLRGTASQLQAYHTRKRGQQAQRVGTGMQARQAGQAGEAEPGQGWISKMVLVVHCKLLHQRAQ